MAVKPTADSAVESIVSLARVSVIPDLKDVLVLGTTWVSGHYGGSVLHAVADLGHVLLLQGSVVSSSFSASHNLRADGHVHVLDFVVRVFLVIFASGKGHKSLSFS